MSSEFEFSLYTTSNSPVLNAGEPHIALLMNNGAEISGSLTSKDAVLRKLERSIEDIKEKDGDDPRIAMLIIEINSLKQDTPEYLGKAKDEFNLREPLVDDIIRISNATVTFSDGRTKDYDMLTVKGSEVMAFTPY